MPAPIAYMYAAGFAPRTCSTRAHCSARGTGIPPSSSETPILSQPPSIRARIDFLKDSGSFTEWVLGSNTGGLRSESANDSAIGPSASRAISPSISVAVSASRSAYAPSPSALSTPSTSNRLNTWSRTLLL
jgi:hypothetical protein